ncbi:MAG TPA: hypothetical protein VMT86_16580 [Bryobacteraceae bacterium]|nr:hypothetical protein [Bryobacteraceae bacterium]
MRAALWLQAVPACLLWSATKPLAIVNTVISDRDGGAPLPADYAHDPGETMFLSFQVEGYAASSAEKVHLSYKMDVFDPRGVRIIQPVAAEIEDTLAPEDKNWKPVVRDEITIPPLAGSGTYKIALSLADVIAQATAAKEITFQVHGRQVEASDTLVIRNIRFYRSEDDRQALQTPAYRPGDAVWARFDMIGFKYGEGNAIDVSYDVSVLAPDGKVLYSQPQADADRSASFYPKRYVPAVMSLATKPNTRPGEYTVVLTAHDGVGHQTFEARHTFKIE